MWLWDGLAYVFPGLYVVILMDFDINKFMEISMVMLSGSCIAAIETLYVFTREPVFLVATGLIIVLTFIPAFRKKESQIFIVEKPGSRY